MATDTTNIYEYGVKNVVIAFKANSAATTWVETTAYTLDATVVAGGNLYKCTTAGTSGATAPTWPASGTVTDGTAVWTFVSVAPAYETPIKIPGATALKIAFKTSQDMLYADDGVWDTINSVSSADLTLKLYQTLPKAIRRRMMGHKADANGIGYVTNAPTPEEFAIGCQFEGKVQNYRRWFYRSTAIDPDEDRSTKGEKVEAYEHELSMTATPQAIGDEDIICSDPIGSVDDKAVYDTFFDSVYVAAATTATLA